MVIFNSYVKLPEGRFRETVGQSSFFSYELWTSIASLQIPTSEGIKLARSQQFTSKNKSVPNYPNDPLMISMFLLIQSTPWVRHMAILACL